MPKSPVVHNWVSELNEGTCSALGLNDTANHPCLYPLPLASAPVLCTSTAHFSWSTELKGRIFVGRSRSRKTLFLKPAQQQLRACPLFSDLGTYCLLSKKLSVFFLILHLNHAAFKLLNQYPDSVSLTINHLGRSWAQELERLPRAAVNIHTLGLSANIVACP